MPSDIPPPKAIEFRWPDSTTGPYLVTMVFHLIDRGIPDVECVRLTIATLDADPSNALPITNRLLRDIPIRQFAREYAVNMAEAFGPTLVGWMAERAAQTKRGLSHTHYQMVANIYRAAEQRGDLPTKTVAQELRITPALATTWVKRARQYGYLEPVAPKGHPRRRAHRD